MNEVSFSFSPPFYLSREIVLWLQATQLHVVSHRVVVVLLVVFCTALVSASVQGFDHLCSPGELAYKQGRIMRVEVIRNQWVSLGWIDKLQCSVWVGISCFWAWHLFLDRLSYSSRSLNAGPTTQWYAHFLPLPPALTCRRLTVVLAFICYAPLMQVNY